MTKEEARLTLQDNFGYLTNEHPRITEALRVALEVLNEDILPSNFDDAVAKYLESQTPADQGEEMTIYNAFKEGAEWYAQQGQTFESVVWQDSDDKLFVEAFVDENKFKMADNVVIQVIKYLGNKCNELIEEKSKK